MKTVLLVATLILLHQTLPAQYETVLFESADETIQIEVPEGKVLEVRTFTHQAGSFSQLTLEKDGRTRTVLSSAYYRDIRNNGVLCSFAGPAILRLIPVAEGGCLTYRMFDNVEPSLSPPPTVRPIVRVRTVCRCRRR